MFLYSSIPVCRFRCSHFPPRIFVFLSCFEKIKSFSINLGKTEFYGRFLREGDKYVSVSSRDQKGARPWEREYP